MISNLPSVFGYTSAQDYLREWFEAAKELKRGISLQSVSAKLGLSSRSHLHRILHTSPLSISPKLVTRLGSVLHHDVQEQDYFEALVAFARSETLEEKNLAHARMHRILTIRNRSTIRADRFAYFSTWYLPTLRELAVMQVPCLSPKELARKIIPNITESQARKGLQLLVELGLLQNTDNGGYTQSQIMIDTGDDLTSLALRNFQAETAKNAAQAIGNLPPEEREVSTLTFSIPEADFPEIRNAVRKLREELIRSVMKITGKPDRVYHINLHCFPTSQRIK